MLPAIRRRWATARKIADRRWVKIALLAWPIIAAYDTFVSQFVPEQFARRFPKAHELILHTSGWLPLSGWALVLAAILAAASFEFAVRRAKDANRPHEDNHGANTAFSEFVPDIRVADLPSALALFSRPECDRLLPLLETEKLSAWARPMRGAEPPLTLLPGEIWKTHYMLAMPKEGQWTRAQTFIKTNSRHKTAYYDLYLNRRQLEQAWPHAAFDAAPSLDRIPCTEFLRIASEEAGWDFNSERSLHLLDMQDAMRQGGADGTLEIWGKLKKWTADELMQKEMLEAIPADHWKEFFVHLFAARDNDNFNTYSWSPAAQSFGHRGYVDLHVGRSQALIWLRRDATSFKGKTKARS